MNAAFDYSGEVALVTGASGALGSAVVEAFESAGADVAAVDVRPPTDDDTALEPGVATFYEADLTDAADTERVVDAVVDDHGRLDNLLNIAGTWRGGDPIEATDADLFDLVFDVNLRTAFHTAKYAIPHLQDTGGAIVSVSAKSSLQGGTGDALYRAAKAGIRLLTESIAKENVGTVRANAVMPSVIDTPANRDMMPDADFDDWVNPADIADVMLFLCSDAATPTSGAAVPVYGDSM